MLAYKNSSLKALITDSSRPDGAFLTPSEFDLIYDGTTADSLGFYIETYVYRFIGTYFNCSADAAATCTTEQLANLQWRTGAVTLARPDHLKYSPWIADSPPSTCLTTNWREQYTRAKLYKCPEFVNYKSASQNLDSYIHIFDEGISMTDEWIASFVTQLILDKNGYNELQTM